MSSPYADPKSQDIHSQLRGFGGFCGLGGFQGSRSEQDQVTKPSPNASWLLQVFLPGLQQAVAILVT